MHTPPQDSLVLTLSVTDPSLDEGEREALAQSLYRQLRGAEDDLGEISRPRAEPPPGAKSASATLLGVLTAVLSAASLKGFFAHLSERCRGREITLEMQASGQTIKLTARSAADMVVAYEAAVALLKEQR